jgi:hypothetical protein
MGFERRRAIYQAFVMADSAHGEKVHGWCVVLAAKRVLLLLENVTFPRAEWRPLPGDWVRLAEQALSGKADMGEVRQVAGNLHYEVGNILEVSNEQGTYTERLSAILHTATHCLAETAGFDLFQNTSYGYLDKAGKIVMYPPTDSFLGSRGGGDTLPAAVMAYALDSETVNLFRWLEFCEWWLCEAIPTAWALAHSH